MTMVPKLPGEQIVELVAPRPTPGSVQEAIARILELQRHVKPDPDGWTAKDYLDWGRRPIGDFLTACPPLS